MRHSAHRTGHGHLWTRCYGTPLSLGFLGLLAAIVVVGPSIASATAARSAAKLLAPAAVSGVHRPAAATAALASTATPSPLSVSPTPKIRTASSTKASSHGPGQFANLTALPTGIPSATDLDAGVPGVAPPSSIADNCSVDVSRPLQTWLGTLAAGTLVRPEPGACFLLDRGVVIQFPQNLTIDGGTFKNGTTPKSYTGPGGGRATFDVLGGSGVTFEDLTIKGTDNSGYHKLLSFEAGIQFQGTAQAVVRNVAIDHVFGDGITMDPLRGAGDHESGQILSPTRNATVSGVNINHSGRQGIGFVSVTGANVDNVNVSDVGLSTFDFEADQKNEGAKDVTIDGCRSSTWNGGVFFANGGASSGNRTSNILVENCQMLHPQGGAAVVVYNTRDAAEARGPITFARDTLWCGGSSYVGCFELTGANVSVTQSTVGFPKAATVHENLYDAGGASTLSFVSDSVRGWKNLGRGRASSTISISGGSWNPAYNAALVHSTVSVSRANKPHQVHLLAVHQAAQARRAARHPKKK